MLRLTLHSEELANLPENSEGAYFKLAFASDSAEQPTMRTYTIAQFRRAQHEMDVDFMLHGEGDAIADGIAAPWAINAKVGDTIAMFGPGPATFINLDANWYLLSADMTALPALKSNLKLLPKNAVGYIVIEILHEEDKQTLAIPQNMNIVWVINPHAGSDKSPLNDAIQQVNWLEGQVAIWAACEFKTMKKIRAYCREVRQVPKSHLYISSYWKQGLKEEEHKVAKREDAST